MGFLDIENIDEECESNIEITLKNLNINESPVNKNEIEIEMEFNLSGDIYQKKEIKYDGRFIWDKLQNKF